MKIRTSSARINDLLARLMRSDGDARRFLIDPHDMTKSIQVSELIDVLEEIEMRREEEVERERS